MSCLQMWIKITTYNHNHNRVMFPDSKFEPWFESLYSQTCKHARSGPEKVSVKENNLLMEVKNVLFVYGWDYCKCLPTGCVQLGELPISGGLTVLCSQREP